MTLDVFQRLIVERAARHTRRATLFRGRTNRVVSCCVERWVGTLARRDLVAYRTQLVDDVRARLAGEYSFIWYVFVLETLIPIVVDLVIAWWKEHHDADAAMLELKAELRRERGGANGGTRR